jgi:hypothetical protein
VFQVAGVEEGEDVVAGTKNTEASTDGMSGRPRRMRDRCYRMYFRLTP